MVSEARAMEGRLAMAKGSGSLDVRVCIVLFGSLFGVASACVTPSPDEALAGIRDRLLFLHVDELEGAEAATDRVGRQIDEKSVLAGVKQALIDFAAIFPEAAFAESDGTLETELVMIGRQLSDPASTINALQVVLQGPLDEVPHHVDVPSTPSPVVNRRRAILHGYSPKLDDVSDWDAERLVSTRVAWEGVLLMPTMVGQSLQDSEAGKMLALDVLFDLHDSAALAVIAEVIRLDFDPTGPGGTEIIWSRLALRDAARLAITDGVVTDSELAHVLDMVATFERAYSNRPDAFQSFVEQFVLRELMPLQRLETDGAGDNVWMPEISSEDYQAHALHWVAVLSAYPREGLTAGQLDFLDVLLAEEAE